MSDHVRPRGIHRTLTASALGLLGLVGVACSGSDEGAASPATATIEIPTRVLTPSEFEAFVEANPNVPLINVHTPYAQHLEGTNAFIPFDAIVVSDSLPPDTSTPLALYCRSGSMSAQAAADLTAAGYTNVIDLDGGMNAWARHGGDLIDDPAAVGR